MTPQLPTLRKVTTLPEMLQFPFWTTVKVTARPELAVALTVSVVPTDCAGIALKVMVCDCDPAATSGCGRRRQAAEARERAAERRERFQVFMEWALAGIWIPLAFLGLRVTGPEVRGAR
jgi:hypothetical protein